MSATDKAMERLQEVSAKKTKELQQKVMNYATAVQSAREVISQVTSQTLRTGIACETFAFKNAFGYLDLGPTQAKEYLHDLAKERGRPFVHAEETHPTVRWQEHKTYTALTFAKTPRLNSLAAQLNLLAVDGASWEHPVTRAHSDRRWRFNFYGPEGEDVLKTFVEGCATDPVRRVILKLNSALPRR